MITDQEVLRELEALGSEQTRKTYRRHGIAGELYGVSYANLGGLRKRLKVNHALAQQLWASGNHDARILATMIGDPAQANDRLIDAWAGDLCDYVLTDALVAFVSKAHNVRAWMERWIEAKNEWTGRAGWHLLGQLAMNDPALPDAFFEPYLARIERDINAEKNRVREAMNNALIAIGMRNDALEERAGGRQSDRQSEDRSRADQLQDTRRQRLYLQGSRAAAQARDEGASGLSYSPKIRAALPPRTAWRCSGARASTRARQPFMSPMLCG